MCPVIPPFLCLIARFTPSDWINLRRSRSNVPHLKVAGTSPATDDTKVNVRVIPRVNVHAAEPFAYRIGEKADGISNAFSCFTTTPGGFLAGHWPVAAAAARTLNRSFASL